MDTTIAGTQGEPTPSKVAEPLSLQRTSDSTSSPSASAVTQVSVVIPVYQGESTLEPLLEELAGWVERPSAYSGGMFRISEVLLVHDGAVDASHVVMEDLTRRYPFVRPLWLSRNFGQHPATLAGMASSAGDWVVTMDEDGQHDPREIASLLEKASSTGVPLVYAKARNAPPHGWLRNSLSHLAKSGAAILVGDRRLRDFFSFRLIRGDVARSLAAYCGCGVYLDVALSWVVDSYETAPVQLRGKASRRSGYSMSKLFRHFWQLVLTSGTKPLRIIAWSGLFSIVVGVVLASKALWEKLNGLVPVPGWTSLMMAICFFSGIILFSLAIIAEYLGTALGTAMGKPLYLVVSRPAYRKPTKSTRG